MTVDTSHIVFSEAKKLAEASAVTPNTRFLVRPSADFWLVGGLSIVALGGFWIMSGLFGKKYEDALIWAYYAAFIVNFPHFMYSYQLFYPRYFRRLTAKQMTLASRIRLAIAGIVVPASMVAYFAFAWSAKDPKYLGWSVSIMMFTVGWHYVKQAYGVLITLSLYRKVFYNILEKRILWLNAYAVWIYTWVRSNSVAGAQNYFDITYPSLGCPSWLVDGSTLLMQIMAVPTVFVLFRYREHFSLNAVIGYIAGVYLWMALPSWNTTFYAFIPFFHSLQYLPFVYKFKKSEFIAKRRAAEAEIPVSHGRMLLYIALFAVGGVVLGALSFIFVPDYTDYKLQGSGVDRHFFIIVFTVYINVHHFFIDNAFWRRDNADVQKYLFKA